MNDDDAKKFYPSTEAAFVAGQRHQKTLDAQAAEEEAEHGDDSSDGLTVEKVQAMSQEEHIARKPEIDAWLAGGQG